MFKTLLQRQPPAGDVFPGNFFPRNFFQRPGRPGRPFLGHVFVAAYRL